MSELYNDFVYGEINDDLIIFPRELAENYVNLWRALLTSKTWGDFRNSVSPEFYDDAKYFSDDKQDEDGNIDDSREFQPDKDDLTGDGDWPPWPAQKMDNYFPNEIKNFGSIEDTRLNGQYRSISGEEENELVIKFTSLGFKITRDDVLLKKASGHGWS